MAHSNFNSMRISEEVSCFFLLTAYSTVIQISWITIIMDRKKRLRYLPHTKWGNNGLQKTPRRTVYHIKKNNTYIKTIKKCHFSSFGFYYGYLWFSMHKIGGFTCTVVLMFFLCGFSSQRLGSRRRTLGSSKWPQVLRKQIRFRCSAADRRLREARKHCQGAKSTRPKRVWSDFNRQQLQTTSPPNLPVQL